MTSPKWTRLLFVPLVVALAGCGTNSTGPYFTAAVGTMSITAATNNKTTLTSGAALNFTTPSGMPSARDEDGPFAACTTQTPTTTVDADSDNVPLTRLRTYACDNVPYGSSHRSLTATQIGTASVTDKDDADPKGGWRWEYNITGGHSGGDAWTWLGFWDLTISGTTITYESDYKGSFSYTASRSGSGTAGGTWKHSITPLDMANPYSGGGAISMDGYYAYNWTEGAEIKNYVFKMSSSGLTYGPYPSCTNFYNAGSYTYTDGSGNTFKVTHTDCTTRTVEYNGTVIP